MKISFSSLKKQVLVSSAAAILLAAILISQYFVPQGAKGQESTAWAMGSYVQQTVYGGEEKASLQAAAAISELENLISWRVAGSDVEKLNSAAGTQWMQFDSRTIRVLQQALSVAKATEGAYDPTILPVSALWNFDSEKPTLPKQKQLEELLPYVGYRFLRVQPEDNTASLRNHGNGVDLGGIGKGAACDTALEIYRKSGVSGAIIAVGGSVGVYGTKPDGSAWRISVRDPEKKSENGLGVLSLHEGCVSTSGSYEKTFTEKNKTYHHLLDAKTGYPAESGLVSVTVVHKSGAVSDALATACFVMGMEKSLPVLKEFGASALFIDKDHHITAAGDMEFELGSSGYTVSRRTL